MNVVLNNKKTLFFDLSILCLEQKINIIEVFPMSNSFYYNNSANHETNDIIKDPLVGK